MSMIVKDKLVARDGLQLELGRCMGIFYVNDGMVGSREPQQIQEPMNGIIGLS